VQTVIRRQKTFFFLAEKARNLYPSEIGNFAESPRFFVNVCSLKHGLRTPRESFFLNLEILGLGRQFGLKIFDAFAVFSTGPQCYRQ
jgi:hypothetical protein